MVGRDGWVTAAPRDVVPRPPLAWRLFDIAASGDLGLVERATLEMAEWPPSWWIGLDRSGRSLWLDRVGADRRAAGRARAAAAETFVELVVCAVEANGYAREAAVERLADRRSIPAMRVLALRCTDPVWQVAYEARKAVERRLRAYDVVALRGAGDLALALSGRSSGQWLVDVLTDVLRGAPESFVEEALAVAEPRSRRLAYEALAARLPLDRLIEAAATDPDLPVRVRAAREAVRVAVETGHVGELRPLARSGTAFVRAAVIHALARAGSPEESLAALGDRSAAVRAVAQADARRAGVDPAAFYRSAPRDAATAAGLGETGSAADAPQVREALGDPRVGVRVAALRALRRLGAIDESLAPLLLDPAPGVTREAVRALRPFAQRLDLVPLLGPSRPAHVRRAAWLLLRERDVLTRVRTDLALLADPDLGPYAAGDLRQWLQRGVATSYLSVEGAWVEESLARAAAVLTEPEIRALRFALR